MSSSASSSSSERRVVPVFTDTWRVSGDAVDAVERSEWCPTLESYVEVLSRWPLLRSQPGYERGRFASFAPLYDNAYASVQHVAASEIKENGGYLIDPYVYVTSMRASTIVELTKAAVDRIRHWLHSGGGASAETIAADLTRTLFTRFSAEPHDSIERYVLFMFEAYRAPHANCVGFVYSSSDDRVIPQSIVYEPDERRQSRRDNKARARDLDRALERADELRGSLGNDNNDAAANIAEASSAASRRDAMLIEAALQIRPAVLRELRRSTSEGVRGRLAFVRFDEEAALEFQRLDESLVEELSASRHGEAASITRHWLNSYDVQRTFVATLYDGPPVDDPHFRSLVIAAPWRLCNACRRVSTRDIAHCTRCKASFYCNRECQRRHWRQHKQYCQRIPVESSSSPDPATIPLPDDDEMVE